MQYRVCRSCGKIHELEKDCECKVERDESRRNWKREYQREYDEENADIVKPLKTDRWKRYRRRIIARDGGVCQRCLIKYGIINGEHLQVHHIKPRISYPELMFDNQNVITLCATCNRNLGTDEQLDFKPNEDRMNDPMEPTI